MEKKLLVLNALKPKVSALGFDKKEVESVAAKIADNLQLAEDASEEDVQKAINEAVDIAASYLAISQQAVTRIVNAQSKKDDKPQDKPQDKPHDKPSDSQDKPDEMPAWAKAMIEQQKEQTEALRAELNAFKAEKTTTSRKARLEEVLKDTGAFGKSTIRQFERMSFKDDDEFDAFLTEVQDDLKTLNQERSDAGLDSLGNPPSAGGKGDEKKTESYNDKELEEMAAQFH
ncbi:MAG: hypothetical protein J5733_05545 [Bacteroidaceae bacterium]|nr:hypothetical protein [Bacteroidaceae bacterium]